MSNSVQADTTVRQRRLATTLGIPAWLLVVGLGLAALLPRITGLNDFYTIDEGYHWPGRVERFSNALAAGDWAATNQSGHPGVTTMWLGALGRQLAAALGVGDPGWAGGGATYLAFLRFPLALVNSLAILAGYALLRQVAGAPRALVACLLWASTPFLVAYSRILHLDALLTSFLTLSLLALLAAYSRYGDERRAPGMAQWSLILLSGLCAGLALLTKAPALILLPVAGLTLAGLEYGAWASAAGTRRHWGTLAGRVVTRYAAWLGSALLIFWAAWPAMWVAPADAVGAVIGEILTNGGQPHDAGNFFLGRPVADPGPLFYLVVIALRTDPITLAGLAAIAGVALRRLMRRQPLEQHTERHDSYVLALAGFAAFFTLVMSAEPKKLDRYLLPIWPALEVLAACGLVALGGYVQRAMARRGLPEAARSRSGAVAITLLLGWQSLQLSMLFPYALAFYNPLMGGGPVAARTILVGIGEGMDQVGAWLRTRPDLTRGDVLSWIPPTLAPFLPDEVLVRDLRPQFLEQASSYAVLYIRSLQHQESVAAEQAVRSTPALYVVQINGIPYAEIHQLARPFALPANTTFGEALLLRGYSQATVGSTLVITPSWSIERDRPGGARVFVHVLNGQGQKVAQVDAVIDQGMFAGWQAGQQFDSPLPISIPADTPAGEYRVVLGVAEPDGTRIGVTRGTTAPPDLDGPHVIELRPLAWPPP